MAEFSIEYDKELGEIDGFSIEEEYNKLQNGMYIEIICEGFGFNALAKDKDGNRLVGFFNYTSPPQAKWIPYDKLTLNTYKTIWNES